jgi:broad specificity phosphatase PhoE
LVRHAKPAATWGEAIDPGLDELGHTQARQAADRLRSLGPLQLYSSPLRRCRETADPLAALWSRPAIVLSTVAEIPSPPLEPAARQKWLHESMQGSWDQLQSGAPPGSPNFLGWRERLLDALREQHEDCVIFTHYIAINVAVGAAQGHQRVLAFRPGHASVTKIEVLQGRISVLELGQEAADTGVLLGR